MEETRTLVCPDAKHGSFCPGMLMMITLAHWSSHGPCLKRLASSLIPYIHYSDLHYTVHCRKCNKGKLKLTYLGQCINSIMARYYLKNKSRLVHSITCSSPMFYVNLC